jgi:signal transduction histidine kinase
VIVPLILLLPLVILILPLGVARGLAPLTHMSRELRERDWHSLEAIGPTGDGKRDVDELAPLAQALDLLLARLRQAALSQQAFIADASHELRTPLAALQILVQMLEEAATPRISDRPSYR